MPVTGGILCTSDPITGIRYSPSYFRIDALSLYTLKLVVIATGLQLAET